MAHNVSPGTFYKFRRSDFITLLESAPPQARPKAIGRMDKVQLHAEALRLAREFPELAQRAAKIAAKLERPNATLLARAVGPCGK